ncbi:MAG: histidine--tRNA ligase [Candidatus Methanomethylicota archaeon]|uniref:Histidine--tRNA ligase n=1 Tax=Thermoproteota archaeon TaxID=2056631 RepID=A0A523BH67_9CREN|nr:MAG: histidine--tRNA ligase [Candidatus Verstraetearchaeota archaeon]TDA40212.1 MAG: histidine--tRNA ligase [Candidatus Verstraetearchaeota archaeon]
MKLSRPRGTRDFLPEEMRIRRYIIDRIRRVFELHGFEEMDTPAIELWEVLSLKSGEEVEHQIYKFQDKAGRWLGLRFDLTVPLARVIASNPNLVKPFKRYCIAKVWRYEEPQSGRYREFLQADIDIIGSQNMIADVECIVTAIDAIKAIGINDIKVKINNRKILEGIFSSMGINKEDLFKVFRIIDKIEKIGEENVIKELSNLNLSNEIIKNIMDIIHKKGEEALDYIEKNFENIKLVKEGLSELREIISLSQSFEINNLIEVDFSLVRGLDYYTGPVFEIKSKEHIVSIAGGGRYDDLIEKFGGISIPATGISLGIERLYEILSKKMISNEPITKIFIANVNEEVFSEVIKIYKKLISYGISTEIDLMKRKLTRQLEYSNSKNIPYVLIVGPKEIKEGIFKLRDMKNKKEYNVKIEEIPKIIKDQIANKSSFN